MATAGGLRAVDLVVVRRRVRPSGRDLHVSLIGLSGEAVLGNFELLSFLASPLGVVALVLLPVSALRGQVLLEYAGLILLTDAALCGAAVPARALVRILVPLRRDCSAFAFANGAGDFGGAAVCGTGALAYRFLLSDADIHYFLAERPPRFWSAVSIAVVLGLGFAVAAIWLLARWALAVPVSVLEEYSSFDINLSTRLMHRTRVAVARCAVRVASGKICCVGVRCRGARSGQCVVARSFRWPIGNIDLADRASCCSPMGWCWKSCRRCLPSASPVCWPMNTSKVVVVRLNRAASLGR